LLVRGWFLILGVLLSGCGGGASVQPGDRSANIEPPNYKEDTIAFLRTYLNDPTGIRDAAISQPVLKNIGSETRYVACLRFNAKKSNGEYAGSKARMAVFLSGRFDRLIETVRDQCNDAAYAPFPELERLSR
jgi:hypothetical protein